MFDWFKRAAGPLTDDPHLEAFSQAASLAAAFRRVEHLLTPEEVSGVMTRMGDSVGPMVALCLLNGGAEHLDLQC